MKQDYIKYALDSVRHKKLRSWLTIISILIGISSIYTLVSFGAGLSNYVDQVSNEVGKDKLIFQSKAGGATGTDDTFFLKKSEIEFLEKVTGIKEAVGIYAKVVELEHKDQKKFSFAFSMDT